MSQRADEIDRMRRDLGQRIDEHFQQQDYVYRILSSIRRLSDVSLGSAREDISDLIGRIGDLQAHMRVDFAEERQALHAVETALRGIRDRLPAPASEEA